MGGLIWDGNNLIMLNSIAQNPRIVVCKKTKHLWPPKKLDFSKSTSSIITSHSKIAIFIGIIPHENRNFYWDIHQFLDKATTEISNKIRIKRSAS